MPEEPRPFEPLAARTFWADETPLLMWLEPGSPFLNTQVAGLEPWQVVAILTIAGEALAEANGLSISSCVARYSDWVRKHPEASPG